ncbi:hypothetical protein BS78_09G162100 [Paspalum vaginatum]|nr:hypothetical protein BS78_09G162100 [Paspalum vaginatum]
MRRSAPFVPAVQQAGVASRQPAAPLLRLPAPVSRQRSTAPPRCLAASRRPSQAHALVRARTAGSSRVSRSHRCARRRRPSPRSVEPESPPAGRLRPCSGVHNLDFFFHSVFIRLFLLSLLHGI